MERQSAQSIRRAEIFRLSFIATFAVLIFSANAVKVDAQTQSAAAGTQDFKYEVSSIKPTKADARSHRSNTGEDAYSASNVSLTRLIRQAYGLPVGGRAAQDDGRVVGAPNWADDGYDVEAKMDGDMAEALTKLDPVARAAARQQMLQALLAERFQLKVHLEERESPVYFLVAGKNGPKLQAAKPGDDYANGYKLPNGRAAGAGFNSDEEGKISGQGVTLDNFAAWLSGQVGKMVQNKTGLPGKYDLTLSWSREATREELGPPSTDAPSDSTDPRPSIFVALQEQLGLKLESGKGPIQVVVVDHAEKPSGN